HRGLGAAQPFQHLQAIDPGKVEVHDHDVGEGAIVRADPRLAGHLPVHGPSLLLEERPEASEQGDVVVDEENRGWHGVRIRVSGSAAGLLLPRYYACGDPCITWIAPGTTDTMNGVSPPASPSSCTGTGLPSATSTAISCPRAYATITSSPYVPERSVRRSQ